MKIKSEKIRVMAIAIMLSLGFSACSTGTDSGEVSVEESDAKDKNPNEHNVTSDQPTSTDSSNLKGMDNAYERTDPDEDVHDSDNDGMADKPKQ